MNNRSNNNFRKIKWQNVHYVIQGKVKENA